MKFYRQPKNMTWLEWMLFYTAQYCPGASFRDPTVIREVWSVLIDCHRIQPRWPRATRAERRRA